MNNKYTVFRRFIGPDCDPFGHFFKITNADENHKGYQYEDGLNVLKEDFSFEGSCVGGGLYFTDAKNIYQFVSYGCNLRDVTLPSEDPELKMVKDPSGGKWRANKIILGTKYDLSKIETHEYLFSKGAYRESAIFYMLRIAEREENFDLVKRLKVEYNIALPDVISTMIYIVRKTKNLELALMLTTEGVDQMRIQGVTLEILIKKKEWNPAKSLIQNTPHSIHFNKNSLLIAKSENTDLILCAINHGMNMRLCERQNEIFQYAIKSESLELVKKCVESGYVMGSNEKDVLLEMIQKNNLEIFEYLVEMGANLKIHGERLLCRAAVKGRLDFVKYMIKKGTNIHANKDEAFQMAINASQLEISQFLYDRGSKIYGDAYTGIVKAIQKDSLDMIMLLDEMGVNLKMTDEYPLRLASEKGHLDIVKFLVEKGSNVRAKNNDAIHRAVNYNHSETVKFLHKSGAKIRARNDLFLVTAAENGYLDIVKYLVENGANPFGNSLAIKKATQNGHTEVAKFFANRIKN